MNDVVVHHLSSDVHNELCVQVRDCGSETTAKKTPFSQLTPPPRAQLDDVYGSVLDDTTYGAWAWPQQEQQRGKGSFLRPLTTPCALSLLC
jgi:hypothetical protein